MPTPTIETLGELYWLTTHCGATDVCTFWYGLIALLRIEKSKQDHTHFSRT